MFTVKYGCESYDKDSISQPTIGEVRSDSTLKAILGFGDNVRALIHGVEQPDEVRVPEGAVVVLETRANTKASLLKRFLNWLRS